MAVTVTPRRPLAMGLLSKTHRLHTVNMDRANMANRLRRVAMVNQLRLQATANHHTASLRMGSPRRRVVTASSPMAKRTDSPPRQATHSRPAIHNQGNRSRRFLCGKVAPA